MKRKVKFKSAEHKRQAMLLAQSWEQLKGKYDVPNKPKKPVIEDKYIPVKSAPPRGEYQRHPSRDTGLGNATKPIDSVKVYTGTKMIGIGTLHKSNSVPIFSSDEAHDISKMRRG